MANEENRPVFPSGAIVWLDTDGHGRPTMSFLVGEDGQIFPNPGQKPEPEPEDTSTEEPDQGASEG